MDLTIKVLAALLAAAQNLPTEAISALIDGVEDIAAALGGIVDWLRDAIGAAAPVVQGMAMGDRLAMIGRLRDLAGVLAKLDGSRLALLSAVLERLIGFVNKLDPAQIAKWWEFISKLFGLDLPALPAQAVVSATSGAVTLSACHTSEGEIDATLDEAFEGYQAQLDWSAVIPVIKLLLQLIAAIRARS